MHPNLGGNRYIGKAVDELRIYQEMKAALPANVRIVLPEDSVNAYSLAEEADVGLTFGSTIGLEMAMLGKPVLLASRALYEYGSQILTVRSKESLPGMLERCLQASLTERFSVKRFDWLIIICLHSNPVSCSDRLGHIRGRVEYPWGRSRSRNRSFSRPYLRLFVERTPPL